MSVYFRIVVEILSVGALPFEAPETAPQLRKICNMEMDGKGK
jgi:hypothetical protein